MVFFFFNGKKAKTNTERGRVTGRSENDNSKAFALLGGGRGGAFFESKYEGEGRLNAVQHQCVHSLGKAANDFRKGAT